MRLADAMISAFRRAPQEVRGEVTFISGNATTRAEAVGAPAGSSQAALSAEQFKASLEISEKHVRISVLASGLRFRPKPGMIAEWGLKEDGTAQRWNVLSVAPVSPNGRTAVLYRVTLKR